MPDPRNPVARTPLHHWHAARGARFVERDGWEVVAAYTTPDLEVETARAELAVADISSFAEVRPRAGLWVVGPRWQELMQRLTQLDLRAPAFPAGARVETALAGVEAELTRREDLTVPSVRVLIAWDVAEYVLERMRESGIDLGFRPLGLDALRLLGG
jgi:glycine cleavage system aminomethyltransferase T